MNPGDKLAVPPAFYKVISTYNSIKSSYYKPVSSTKLANGAINGMMESLGDKFSTYLQDNDKKDLDDTMSASFGGIGATVEQNGTKLTVQSVQPASPAKKAGIRAGDQLMAVNGKSVEKQSVSEAVTKIRGKIGTTVKVTIRRDNADQTVTMKRAQITQATVTSALNKTDKSVGVITVASFSDPTATQFENAVKKLRKQGAKKFIVDLRGNGGGELNTALRMASMGLKNGQTIVKVQDRAGKTQVYKAGKGYDEGFKINAPIAILIDGNSASASEILAAAWHQGAGVPLIGSQSYGKGTVQNVAQLGDNAEVKLTVAKWLTPNGTWINHKGLTPTIKADYPAWAKIAGFATVNMKLGDESNDVKSLQTSLAALGYDVGAVNGYFGPTVQAAVRKFQQDNHLPVTGETNDATLTKMITLLSAKLQTDDAAMDAAVKQLDK
ncbi:S41 family peptidase [Lacticaseibacillus camelliae]|uniref:S41 family peptidase n=1 Tax=Lacticaseibacillus camelliae TaxID=381742 RepID=UPI000A69007A|nr:S41 family peptidase [Lacticaseibacillus camelliae]